MKKLIFSLSLCSLILSSKAYSLDTSVRGFIALDALNFEKISSEKGSAVIGIGVLDLKVFAEQDYMTAAIKLDLDGKLEKENNIFEEAYATYRGVKDWRFSLGKGVVRFQNLHWGAIENSYQDGGSVIGSDNSYRKVSRKAFISASYGGRTKGYINQFTFWGDSVEFDLTQDGKLDYVTTGSNTAKQITGYKTENVTAFSTSKQLGLANKLEYFHNDQWKYTFGQLYYKNDFQKRGSYALDLGANYESSQMEIWIDALYGFTTKLPYDSFSTLAKTEYFLQIGSEYFLDEKWSVVGNTEGLYLKDQAHTYSTFSEGAITYSPNSDQQARSGAVVKSLTYKIESALKYKLSKTAHLTFGGLFEKKIVERNGVKNLSFIRGVYNANAEAYKLSSSVSFWF